MLAYNVNWIGKHTPVFLTPAEALLGAPFTWWLVSSVVASLLLAVFWSAAALVRAPMWAVGKLRPAMPSPEMSSPPRRDFLHTAANVVAAAPFLAGAYGILKGRLDLQITHQPIRLPRLPAAFHGFKIAQLSDIHIGPFMTYDQIREYAGLTNSLKPDLIVLTGDYVTWDRSDSISRGPCPFRSQGSLRGIRQPGQSRRLGGRAGLHHGAVQPGRHTHPSQPKGAPWRSRADSLNLMGIDYATLRLWAASAKAWCEVTWKGQVP